MKRKLVVFQHKLNYKERNANSHMPEAKSELKAKWSASAEATVAQEANS